MTSSYSLSCALRPSFHHFIGIMFSFGSVLSSSFPSFFYLLAASNMVATTGWAGITLLLAAMMTQGLPTHEAQHVFGDDHQSGPINPLKRESPSPFLQPSSSIDVPRSEYKSPWLTPVRPISYLPILYPNRTTHPFTRSV